MLRTVDLLSGPSKRQTENSDGSGHRADTDRDGNVEYTTPET
ncbi:MAG: hypothetical protein UW70_C0041G0001, partial [Candidatus Peregrinibacteria bacterium GW2011_GWA2_44_7]